MSFMRFAVAAASGAALGSAAGAALARWPNDGSLRAPLRSRCSGCGTALRARDLVPIISWLMLRGRCRTCGAAIDARLPLLEGLSAAAVVAVVLVHGGTASAGFLSVGVVAALLAGFSDLDNGAIPNRLTYPLAAFALAGALVLASGAGPRATIVAWSLGLPLLMEAMCRLAVATGRRRPIGGGDVKLLIGLLALALVAPQGPQRLLASSFLFGGIHAGVGLVRGRITLGGRIPFAPSIGVAFLTVVLLPDSQFPVPRIDSLVRA